MSYTSKLLFEENGKVETIPANTIEFKDGQAIYHKEKLEIRGGVIEDKKSVDDTEDLYATAGFINCHMHWLMNGDATSFDTMLEEIATNPVKKAEAGIAHAKATLELGITFGWDKGPPGVCALPAYAHMQDAIKKGATMTRFIYAPWAVMYDGCFGFPFGRVVSSEKEIDIILREAASAGAKAIKFIPESKWLIDEDCFEYVMPNALFEEARKKAAENSLLFAVHAKGTELLDQCIAVRVDCIEHAIQATEHQMLSFQKENIYIGPTLYGLECRLAKAREWQQGEDTALYEWETVCDMVKRASTLNLGKPFTRMLFSSDAGSFVTPHASLRELYLMRKCGFSPASVFEAATVNGARCTGQNQMGTIGKGKVANLIYWSTNPLELPIEAWGKLEDYIAAVILEGKVVYSK